MGTRSLTRVYDTRGLKYIVNIYRQFDGYPEGQGKDLAEFLRNRTIVNGISSYTGKISNGVHDLAAQLVAYMKEGSSTGGVYLFEPNSREHWEEFVYDVKTSWAENDPIIVECFACCSPDKLIFHGDTEAFYWWVHNVQQDDDYEYIVYDTREPIHPVYQKLLEEKNEQSS